MQLKKWLILCILPLSACSTTKEAARPECVLDPLARGFQCAWPKSVAGTQKSFFMGFDVGETYFWEPVDFNEEDL